MKESAFFRLEFSSGCAGHRENPCKNPGIASSTISHTDFGTFFAETNSRKSRASGKLEARRISAEGAILPWLGSRYSKPNRASRAVFL